MFRGLQRGQEVAGGVRTHSLWARCFILSSCTAGLVLTWVLRIACKGRSLRNYFRRHFDGLVGAQFSEKLPRKVSLTREYLVGDNSIGQEK